MTCVSLWRATCALLLPLLLLATAPTQAADSMKDRCIDPNALSLGDGKCIYTVNILNSELRYLDHDFASFVTSATTTAEAAFVKYLHEEKPHPSGMRNTARLLGPLPLSRIPDERFSADGVVLVRAFCDGNECATNDPIKDAKVLLNDKPLTLLDLGPNTRVAELHDVLQSAKLGDRLTLRVEKGKDFAVRTSWYRPRNELVVGYALLGVAFVWPTWQMRGQPETALVPAMVELSYRYYKPNGSTFFFTGFGIGPNVVLERAEVEGDNKSGTKSINGLVAAASIDINGLKLGFGTRWNWLLGRFDPMLTFSVTDAVARGLQITDFPKGIVNISKSDD